MIKSEEREQEEFSQTAARIKKFKNGPSRRSKEKKVKSLKKKNDYPIVPGKGKTETLIDIHRTERKG